MIDEFDLIERDLHVFRALSPESLHKRVEYLRENMDMTWGIRIEKGVMSREGQLADNDRAKGVRDLVKRFLHEVPDMLMWYNGHDIARVMIPWEEKDRLEQFVEAGKCAYNSALVDSRLSCDLFYAQSKKIETI